MAEKQNKGKRLDKNRLKLRKGESQRKNGSYDYRWTTPDGKRHTIYAATLDELREKEEAIISDKRDGIKVENKRITVNDMFDLWCTLKRGIKDNTFQNYVYMYNMFVRHTFGRQRLTDVKKSDVRRFYNRLVDERVMSISTIDTVQNILHQVFNVAIEDGYMRTNPTDNMLKELKQSHNFQQEKRNALTSAEQNLLIDFLKRNRMYNHWYPVFAVMLGTGMRVGEMVLLNREDINFNERECVVFGKGDKERIVYFDARTKIHLLNYLESRTDSEPALFVSLREPHQRLKIGGVEVRLRTLGKRLNIPKVHPHKFRRTLATMAIDKGMPIEQLQQLLGHRRIDTTLQYAMVKQSNVKIAHRKYIG